MGGYFRYLFEEISFAKVLEKSLLAALFTNFGKRSLGESYYPERLLSVVSKLLRNFQIMGVLITLRSVMFSYYIYASGSSHSTADLLMAVTKRIAGDLIISGATQAVAVDIPQVS